MVCSSIIDDTKISFLCVLDRIRLQRMFYNLFDETSSDKTSTKIKEEVLPANSNIRANCFSFFHESSTKKKYSFTTIDLASYNP